MRYAIETQDGVFVQNGDTPFPEGSAYPAPLDYNPPKYYKIVNGQVVEKSDEEKSIIDLPVRYRRYENGAWRVLTIEERIYEDVLDLPEKYRKLVDGIWVELTQEEKDAVDHAEADAIIVAEEAWQNNKSSSLKMIENVYVDFLANQWTTCLRQNGLITSDDIITVDNTDEMTNIGYLLTIRSIDFDVYGKMAGEFDRLKSTIINLGGIMSKVRTHGN